MSNSRGFTLLALLAAVYILYSSDSAGTLPLDELACSTTSKTTDWAPDGNLTASVEWASSLTTAQLGNLGPGRTTRSGLRYYDSLYYLSLQYGAHAESLLEVGCADDPFAGHLSWIPSKTCVAPYYVKYGGRVANKTNAPVVDHVKADFVEWKAPQKYDLVICGQVLEHVKDPRKFLLKLIRSASHATIISVPYMWRACGAHCGHLHHYIDEKRVAKWAAPYKPLYYSVVTEKAGDARIIAVFGPGGKI